MTHLHTGINIKPLFSVAKSGQARRFLPLSRIGVALKFHLSISIQKPLVSVNWKSSLTLFSMAETSNFCPFCVQNEWKIVRRWHHNSVICIYSYRLVKKRFLKICETSKCHNFLIFQLILIKFSLFCSNIFTLSSKIKLSLFWISPFIMIIQNQFCTHSALSPLPGEHSGQSPFYRRAHANSTTIIPFASCRVPTYIHLGREQQCG